MENETFNANIIVIEGLKVSQKSTVPAFILLLLIYIFIMVSNIGLVVLISMERSLHEPMYLLFCNMSINDVFGATTIIPRLLSNIFSPITDRYIHYIDCVVQAFSSHFHAGTSHTVLMVMAFDRYMAICNPLRYASIMTNRMVLKLSVGAWLAAFISVAILLGLTIRLTRCRRIIINPFCDNASLFKLSCQNLLINHIYGLGSAVVILGSSLGSITLTYLRIAMVCLSSKNKVLNSRALQTCATHLAVYIIMLVASFTPMIMHRRPEWADSGKVSSVLFHVVPPILNPLIYGMQCKELRHKIISLFHKNKVTDAKTLMHVQSYHK
ncbi:olfactory receptor 2F1-like [Tautogolabrus adspersus]